MNNIFVTLFLLVMLLSCSSESNKTNSVNSLEINSEELVVDVDPRIVFFRDSLNIKKGKITPVIVTMPDYCGACNKAISEFINSQVDLNNLLLVTPKESIKKPEFQESISLIMFNQESIRKSRLFITTAKIYVFDGESILYESSIHDANLDIIRKDLLQFFPTDL